MAEFVITAATVNWSAVNSTGPTAPGPTDDIVLANTTGCTLVLDGLNNAVYTCNSVKGFTSGAMTTPNHSHITISNCTSPGPDLNFNMLCGNAPMLTLIQDNYVNSVKYVKGGTASVAYGISLIGNATNAAVLGQVNSVEGGRFGHATASTRAAGVFGGTASKLGSINNVLLAHGSLTTNAAAIFGESANLTINNVQAAHGGHFTDSYGVHANGACHINTVVYAEGGTNTSTHGINSGSGGITTIQEAKGGSGSGDGINNQSGPVNLVVLATGGASGNGVSSGGDINVVETCIGGGGNYGIYAGGLINSINLCMGSPTAGVSGVYGYNKIEAINNCIGGSFAGAHGIATANSVNHINSCTGGSVNGAYGISTSSSINTPIDVVKGGTNLTNPENCLTAYGFFSSNLARTYTINSVDNTGTCPAVGLPNIELPPTAWVGSLDSAGTAAQVHVPTGTVVDPANVLAPNYNYTGGSVGTLGSSIVGIGPYPAGTVSIGPYPIKADSLGPYPVM